ncbi:CHAT domain-containing protein [Lactarius psammicola]|nr:CHAT domain-containing protein [Lactarius psammicola]
MAVGVDKSGWWVVSCTIEDVPVRSSRARYAERSAGERGEDGRGMSRVNAVPFDHYSERLCADRSGILVGLLSFKPQVWPVPYPTVRFGRYELSNQKDDLDKAILHLTESILLKPWSCLEPKPNILAIFFNLAVGLYQRSNDFKQPEDATYAAKYLRHLRDRSHESFGFPHLRITTLLVDALAVQVKLGAGNVMENIGEMAVLCRELCTLDMFNDDTTRFRHSLCQSSSVQNQTAGPRSTIGSSHRVPASEAAYVLDEIIGSSSFGDSQDEFVAQAQQVVTLLAMVRSKMYQTPEYSEEAIYRGRAFLSSAPVEQQVRPAVCEALRKTEEQRFRFFGSIEGLEASSSDSPLSQPVPVLPFGEYEDDNSEFDRIHQKTELLKGLLIKIRNNDITDIEEAIENGRTILASSAPCSSAARDHITSYHFDLFGDSLFEAFLRTKKIEYLDESISTHRQVLERPWLSTSLVVRFVHFPGHRLQDLEEGLELFSQCVNDPHANLPNRFRLASYETAVSILQDTLLFAPTLQLQHATLVTSDDSHRMPLDYASFQVDLHQLEEAVETLERGRALLWSEMRHLRAPIDQILEADPNLGHKFAAINRDLEELTKSIPPSHKLSMDDGAADDLRAADPFGRLLLKQRGLLKERDKLISQIQALPGFKSFLTSPSFDTLRSAASCGPVIIINHSRWRSDILIVLHNTSPSLIPTPANFYRRASALKDDHYDQSLAYVLVELYNLVGKPVIDRLRQLKVPEQSRIWWCPTSVFCSLPLHAMGPITSDEGEKRYFLGPLYLFIYPIAPDSSLPTVGGEIQVVQALDTEVTSLISEAATPAAVIDGFHHHPFVHFACHGTLEAGKPFEAGFELHKDERLTLLEIVRSHLPTAEFAFLSACHTAEVTEGSVADEGLHLAAAVQYCGFRSVVGTMWAMVDEDGRDLAEIFYKALFSTSRREQGVPYHERSAKALRFAVKKLRRKRWITLERWVNFVHYGA